MPPVEVDEPIYEEAELSSIPPDETYEPSYDDVYSGYSVSYASYSDKS